LPGLRIRRLEAALPAAKFDLALSFSVDSAGFRAVLEYGTDLFDRDTVLRMAGHLERLLEQVAGDPDRRLSELELPGQAERRRVVEEWNRTAAAVPAGRCIHELFEAQVERTPGAVALVHEARPLTYAELNERANRLARRLAGVGVGPEVRVGLCLERGPELLVALLAVLKAGGAYVPLDPGYPAERLAYLAEDADLRVVLAQAHLRDVVPGDGIQVVALEDDISAGAEDGDLSISIHPDNLAYVIYTSGSTGKPKGVGVTHANVLRLFEATDEWFGFDAGDAWTLFHSYAFDFSVWEIWGALLYGGRIVVVPWETSRDPAAFRALLARERVTVLNQTPSAFRALAAADEDAADRLESLRYVIFGGEALQYESLRGWLGRYGPERPRLVNMYGITETTVHVTYHPVTGAELEDPAAGSGVGIPIPDIRVYVLDAHGHPAPIGVPGEMFVGGAGPARGYLGRPALTAEKFVPDPFSTQPGARLYRSGDRARWTAGGELEYLGRIDQQVKIRGFRIELGEIEAELRAHPGVHDAVVVDYEHEPGDRRLAAYVVPDAERAGTPLRLLEMQAGSALDGHAVETLPDGTPVVSLNPHETRFLYEEIFERGAYLGTGADLPPDACVFDVGANIGMFTLSVARRCPRARVFAFEPIPPVAEALRLNAALHGGDVHVLECGLAEAEGQAEFTFYPNASVLSGRHAAVEEEREVVKAYLLNQDGDAPEGVEPDLDALLDYRLSTQQFACRLRTLSSVIREEGVERIDLLKVDVEKSELEVLAGLEDGDWEKVRTVALEVHDTDGRLARVRALLESRGFRVETSQETTLAGTCLYEVLARRPGVPAERADAPPADEPRVWRSAAELVQDLRRAAGERLPEYMVPSAFVPIARIPLTPNGKVDRRVLPAPEHAAAASAFVAPRGPVEEALAGIWAELLGVDRVGANDGFFELGGHSLLATRVASRVRDVFGVELPVRALFEAPTVAELAGRVEALRGAGAT
ncbi:MAG TPA: amino acid adenylation domain-containing protein, partial [Longimicrobiaceae bacterium]